MAGRLETDRLISMEEATSLIKIPASVPPVALLGVGDSLIKRVEQVFAGVVFQIRGNEIALRGDVDEVTLVERVFSELADSHRKPRCPPGRFGREAIRCPAVPCGEDC